MYTYCGSDPINYTDPSGLFFGELFKWLSKALKWIMLAVVIAVVILTIVGAVLTPVAMAAFMKTMLGQVLGFIAGLPGLVGNFISGLPKMIAGVFSFLSEATAAATAANAVGWGVLAGTRAAAGAIGNHLDKKRRKETPEQRRKRLIRSAIESALWRLRNMPGCKDYIQGSSGHDPISTLEGLRRNSGVVYDSTLGSGEHSPVEQVYGSDVGRGPNSKIRLGDKWFEEAVGGWKGTMNAPRTRTNVVLHGTKHAVGGRHRDNEPNNEYYNEIARKCFGIQP